MNNKSILVCLCLWVTIVSDYTKVVVTIKSQLISKRGMFESEEREQGSFELIDFDGTMEHIINLYNMKIVMAEENKQFTFQQGDKTWMSNIPYEMTNEKRYDEYLELNFSLDKKDLVSVQYGIDRYLTRDQSGSKSVMIRMIEPQKQILTSVYKESQSTVQIGIKRTEEGEKKEEEQGYFKKYFWYIVIGGVVMMLSGGVDQEKKE